MDTRDTPSDTRQVISSDRHLLGHDRPRRHHGLSNGPSFNGLLLSVFVFVLSLGAVVTTVQLQWKALLLWALAAGLALYAGFRARDRAPQEARLEGTVLTVRRWRSTRSCDLANTRTASLGFSLASGGEPTFMVLDAVDAVTGVQVHYLMRTEMGRALSPSEMRMLADAFAAAPPGSERARRMAAQLRVEATALERSAKARRG